MNKKSEKNILIAFLLNLLFCVVEYIGGILTNSVAILSDAFHDLGDSLSIGISYFLEKKSKKKPDKNYTYGYRRYSVLGAVITTVILFIASIFVIYESIKRIINPATINYNGMIILALLGFFINLVAAMYTKDGNSLNQKSVNLHMLEDVLGWLVVLIGSILMKFTDIKIIDPLMSIGVALFILINSFKNLKEILNLFLEKTPQNISIKEIENHLLKIDGIENIHHIHVWSIDGENNYATMHVVTNANSVEIKKEIRKELEEFGICHVTLELESAIDDCEDKKCDIKISNSSHHHHHH